MAIETLEQQLVKYLTDVHSIEEQALTQLHAAPDIAGDEHLAAIFERHLFETEGQEEQVRARLEAHDAAPARFKDVAGRAGGAGMVLFAQSQPDTPGKLVAHAFSYEHMETAAYEMLSRVAERADDAYTVTVAEAIGSQERRMASRLERAFDRAVDASLRDVDPGELGDQLDTYLADAHAIEMQAVQLLDRAQTIVGDEVLAGLFEEHLAETRGHEGRVRARLEARGAKPSILKDAAMRLGAINIGIFFQVQSDTPAKLAGFAYAFEHLEIAAYQLLAAVAARAGDLETERLAEVILDEERAAAGRLAHQWDRAIGAALEAQGVAV